MPWSATCALSRDVLGMSFSSWLGVGTTLRRSVRAGMGRLPHLRREPHGRRLGLFGADGLSQTNCLSRVHAAEATRYTASAAAIEPDTSSGPRPSPLQAKPAHSPAASTPT